MKISYYYLLTAALLALATTCAAGEMARMRYTTALAVAKIDVTDIEGIASQAVKFSVRSRLPGVKPSDIRITLDSPFNGEPPRFLLVGGQENCPNPHNGT